jgi:hypothetical protein
LNEKKFKSEFIKWAREDYQLPEDRISAFKHVIDKQFWSELETRDIDFNIVLRPLSNTQGLSASYSSEEVILYQNPLQELVVGSITPDWKHGWRCIDDDVRDLLQFYLHFAEQYVARSRALNVTGAISLTFDKACDFRYKGFYSTRLNRFDLNEIKQEQYQRMIFSGKFKSKKEFNGWLDILNCLDPLIHRMVYNYWKGTKLYEQNDFEDSVTSFCSCISVVSEYCQKRLNEKGGNRIDKIEALDVHPEFREYFEDLEELRNHFGAHPSHTKWWDFSELFEEELPIIISFLKDIVKAVCLHESKNRVINKVPEKWSNWLRENGLIVFDAVWFHKLPKLKAEY